MTLCGLLSVCLLDRSPGSPVVPVPLCAANKVCTAAASLFFLIIWLQWNASEAELNAVMKVRAGCFVYTVLLNIVVLVVRAFCETGTLERWVSAAPRKWHRLWCCVKSQWDWWGLQLSGTLASGAARVLLSRGLRWSRAPWLSAIIICFNTISSVCAALETRAETLWGPHSDSYRNILKGKPPLPPKQKGPAKWARTDKKEKTRHHRTEETMKEQNKKQRSGSNRQRWVDGKQTAPGPNLAAKIKTERTLPEWLSLHFHSHNYNSWSRASHSHTEHLLTSHTPDHTHTSSIIEALLFWLHFIEFTPTWSQSKTFNYLLLCSMCNIKICIIRIFYF